MLRVSLLATLAFLGIAPVGTMTAHAQVAEGRAAVVDSKALRARVGLTNLDVNRDALTLWAARGASPSASLAARPDRFLQAPTSARSRARARSTTRIVAGAIVGSVGGFFAGGFLGAHIEGDRCDCDDPGVRGFLIGAPIGAVAGGIVGAKVLF